MSRITPPVTKFTHAIRMISSSANVGRPSGILASNAGSNVYLPRKTSDLKAECVKRQLKTSGSKTEVIPSGSVTRNFRLTTHSLWNV